MTMKENGRAEQTSVEKKNMDIIQTKKNEKNKICLTLRIQNDKCPNRKVCRFLGKDVFGCSALCAAAV